MFDSDVLRSVASFYLNALYIMASHKHSINNAVKQVEPKSDINGLKCVSCKEKVCKNMQKCLLQEIYWLVIDLLLLLLTNEFKDSAVPRGLKIRPEEKVHSYKRYMRPEMKM